MSKSKSVNWISRDLLNQFESSWKMLAEAIYNVHDEQWYQTDNDWTFAKTVYHILETQEFYIRNTPEGMEWGKKFLAKELDKEEPEKYFPSKEMMIEFQEQLEEEITALLKNLTLEDYMKKDGFKWFNSIYHKLTYLLRHNAHHLGELGRMLRAWEQERMKWQ